MSDTPDPSSDPSDGRKSPRPARTLTDRQAVGLALAWMVTVTAVFAALTWDSVFYPEPAPWPGSTLLILLPAAAVLYFVARRPHRYPFAENASVIIVVSIIALIALAMPGQYTGGYTIEGCLGYEEERVVPTRVGWATFGLVKPTQTIYIDCNGRRVDAPASDGSES